jgi:NodT family efflux transporter outer membrane factor (OMF) lipoprotein
MFPTDRCNAQRPLLVAGAFMVSLISLTAVLMPAVHAAPLPQWWWWNRPNPAPAPSVTALQSSPIPSNTASAAPAQSWRDSDPATSQGVWPVSPLTFDQAYPQANWWQAWNDPTLSGYITEALSNNPSLQAAASRIRQVQALEQAARASRLPTAQLAPSYTLQKFSANQFGFSGGSGGATGNVGSPGSTFQFYSVPLTARYEVDLWAQNRDRQLAANQAVVMARHDYRNLILQLSAMVGTAYVNLLKADAQLQLQAEVETLLAQEADHATRRLQAGLTNGDEVLLRQQAMATARQQTAQWQSTRALALDQMAVLLGRTPAQVADLPRSTLAALAVPTQLRVGVPSELVLHRPDVLASEAALEQAAIQVRVARKEVLPKLVLTGQTGFTSIGFAKLFDWASLANSVGVGITQPVFSGGLIKAGLAANRATQQQVGQQYVATLQAAFAEVEDSLVQFKGDYEQWAQGQAVLSSVAQQANLERSRFKAGLSSEVTYLPKQVVVLQARQAVVAGQAAVLVDAIGVSKAVGGGV